MMYKNIVAWSVRWMGGLYLVFVNNYASANIAEINEPSPNTPNIYWPTPNDKFFKGSDIDELLQPTQSGKLKSALFGCVRKGGQRFHEGIDLKPIGRNRRGEATDAIFAIMDGTIAHVNRVPGNSSYGRYVVIEHLAQDVAVYTLYSHLAKIHKPIQAGAKVNGGAPIGIMGRSAGGYAIPKSRAHLHFEIGLRKSDAFDDYYSWRKLRGKNHHGNLNGLNLVGMDPLHFFTSVRDGEFRNFQSYIDALPTAFTMRVATRSVPDFVTRYPQLVDRKINVKDIVGWEIAFTWYGLPKRWTPLQQENVPTNTEGTLSLISYDTTVFAGKCRDTLRFNGDTLSLGKSFKADIQLLFGFR